MNTRNFKRAHRNQHSQRGLSLIELMISLVISAAVIAGSVQVLVSSKRNYLDQDEVVFIQNNIRYALDLIGRDVRMAGYMGCASGDGVEVANAIVDSANGFISTHGIRGFESKTNKTTFPIDYRAAAKTGSDSFMIRRANDENHLNLKVHKPYAAILELWETHSYPAGTTLMITDAACRSVGLFQVSGPGTLPHQNLNHALGGATKNCTQVIKGNFACDASCTALTCGGHNAVSSGYAPGSKVMEYISHAYYVGDSEVIPGMPALKRQVLVVGSTPATVSQEIALGVIDMQLLYGVDADGDGSAEMFRAADNMDADGNGVTNDIDWGLVSSVSISLVFRSQNPVLPQNKAETIVGKSYNDKYLRQVVTTTIKIRNRG